MEHEDGDSEHINNLPEHNAVKVSDLIQFEKCLYIPENT